MGRPTQKARSPSRGCVTWGTTGVKSEFMRIVGKSRVIGVRFVSVTLFVPPGPSTPASRGGVTTSNFGTIVKRKGRGETTSGRFFVLVGLVFHVGIFVVLVGLVFHVGIVTVFWAMFLAIMRVGGWQRGEHVGISFINGVGGAPE